MKQGKINKKSQSAPQKKNSKNIIRALVIGETGSGKSTFINTLTNYFKKGSLDQLFVSIPTQFLKATEKVSHSERNLGSPTESQTDECTRYYFSNEIGNFEFVDTPGLSDTRGINQDDENLEKILKTAEESDNLAALVIVVNGTLSKLTTTMKNTLTRLKGSIPDSVLKNTIVLFTHCWKEGSPFELKTLKPFGKEKNCFWMDNPAFSTDPRKWDKKAKGRLQVAWDDCMEQTEKLCEAIAKLAPLSVQDFVTMRNTRNEIKEALHQTKLKIVDLQKFQDELYEMELALKRFGNDQERFKNYVQKKTMTTKQLVDAPYHSTLCSSCNHVCHDNCGLNETSTKGDNIFQGCSAMNSNGTCSMCPSHCSFRSHYHARKTMKQVEQSMDEILQDMKTKFDQAVQGSNHTQQKITSTKDAKKLVEKAIDEMSQEITSKCHQLKSICSAFNLVDELHELLEQLRLEAKLLTSSDARKTAEGFIRAIKTIADQLSTNSEFMNSNNSNPPTSPPSSRSKTSLESSEDEQEQ